MSIPSKPIKVSAGIEPLKRSIRLWWRVDGIRHRETLAMPPTEQNITHATQIAQAIIAQIRLGIFNRDEFFPNSVKRSDAYFGYWCQRYKDTTTDIAPSSRQAYLSKIAHHIEPHWANQPIAKITHDDVETWVNTLKKTLSVKTIKDIVMLFNNIWGLWARDKPNAISPTKYIRLKTADSDDIDPFTKDEIHRIITGESDPMFKNLWTVVLWTGLSAHEVLPLAVEDMSKQGLYVRRGFVKGVLKATKNRRRKRVVQLLPIAKDAINDQIKRTTHGASDVQILQRDHHNHKNTKLTWLWYNPKTGTHHTYGTVSDRWTRHLQRLEIRHRGLNHGRHTYASQVLSTGAVSAEWLASQLGHSDTQMIHRHYGKFMTAHTEHFIQTLDHALNQS